MHDPEGADWSATSKILRDITERKLAHQMLQEQADVLRDADRRKDEFLATLAHELRNPLAPIRNGLQVLKLAGDNAAPPRTPGR